MSTLPPCPQCASAYTYEDGEMYVCPECAHEWSKTAASDGAEPAREVRDAVGNLLKDGDSVTVLKVGTKVKNIRLIDADHDIDCKIDGIGAMSLKSEFVKKS